MVRHCGNIFGSGCISWAPVEQAPPSPAAPQPLMTMVLTPLTQPNFWIWYYYPFLLHHLLPDYSCFQLLLILGWPHYPGMIHQQLYHYANNSLNFTLSFWKTYYCFSLSFSFFLPLVWSYRFTHTCSFPILSPRLFTYQICARECKGGSPLGSKMHISSHPFWKITLWEKRQILYTKL